MGKKLFLDGLVASWRVIFRNRRPLACMVPGYGGGTSLHFCPKGHEQGVCTGCSQHALLSRIRTYTGRSRRLGHVRQKNVCRLG